MLARYIGNLKIYRFLDDPYETINISSDHITEATDIINTYGFKSADILSDYQKADIDFLKDCPAIELLQISNLNIKNFDGLKYLTQLKGLGLNVNRKAQIDLGNLKELEELTGTIPNKLTGLEDLTKLTKVQLFGFSPSSQTLLELTAIQNLELLTISQGAIQSLAGIEKMKHLKEIFLYGLKKLNDISALESATGAIEDFSLEMCKNINDFSPFKYLENMRSLRILDCGNIPTLAFIESLESLESLTFDGSTILDGDLSFCERLEYVYFNQKKHYSHRLKDLNS